MKKSAKIITGIVVVGVLALLIVPRFLKPAETADPAQPPVVQAEAPQTGSITLYRELTGTDSAFRYGVGNPEAGRGGDGGLCEDRRPCAGRPGAVKN